MPSFAQQTQAWSICTGAVLVAVYYSLLISNGSFNLFQPPPTNVVTGVVFNSMLTHLLQGDFAVDSDAVLFEGYLRDGKVYSYFGIAPALLRIPLLIFPDFATTDMTALSIVLAACVAAYFKCSSLLLIRDASAEHSMSRAVCGALILWTLVGGPQVQFLKSSIYQEVISWAMALNAAFIYCAVRGLFLKAGFSRRLLAWMAFIAGLALLTRVTAGVGLCFALAALGLSLATRSTSFSLRGTVGPACILACFVIIAGVVNYGRWANPLVFADVHLHRMLAGGRIAVIDQYGEFNLLRLPFSLLYYFLPINFLRQSDGTFLFGGFRARYYDGVELPPSSLLISDPVTILLAGVLLWTLLRRAAATQFDRRHASMLLIGFLVPILLILTYYYLAFRFRGEFYPFLEFAALLGFSTLGAAGAASSSWGKRAQSAVNICVMVGIVTAHAGLLAYKLSPFDSAERFLSAGWQKSYGAAVATWMNSRNDIW